MKKDEKINDYAVHTDVQVDKTINSTGTRLRQKGIVLFDK